MRLTRDTLIVGAILNEDKCIHMDFCLTADEINFIYQMSLQLDKRIKRMTAPQEEL